MDSRTFTRPKFKSSVLGKPSINTEWEVLGPFQIGTREAPWGADPLEVLGGFRSLSYSETALFPSSIGTRGLVGWTKQTSQDAPEAEQSVETALEVSFPSIDWETVRGYYGWAALQYQAWGRTEFAITGSGRQAVMIYTDSILEFYVDDQLAFGGDFYSYRRAPLIVHLDPGSHRLDVRLFRDVRAMGGTGAPTIPIKVKIRVVPQSLLIDAGSILLPEIVRGRGPASKYGSAPVHNCTQDWIVIGSIVSRNADVKLDLVPDAVRVAPGQSKSLAFLISIKQLGVLAFDIVVKYHHGRSQKHSKTSVEAKFQERSIQEPHRYTFLHPAGQVSYAIVKVPNAPAGKNTARKTTPVLLALHGAGLEADDELVRHQLDPVEDLAALTIFPTGSTPWSGDDWHTWGLADVNAAVSATAEWAKAISWNGPAINPKDLWVVGHSNGGQGTWFITTHNPDRINGAGPISGYASIQAYVPYVWWTEMEPRIWSMLQTSLSSFKHELLMDNITHIELNEQQHGSLDDNVPPYHSRRLFELIKGSGGLSRYTELEGAGHYFDGVLTTPALRTLYSAIDKDPPGNHVPNHFRTVIPNSGDMHSRFGIFVDQLQSPDVLGLIEGLSINKSKWQLRTSNIRRFHLTDTEFVGDFPDHLVVDGFEFSCVKSTADEPYWFLKDEEQHSWSASQDCVWRSVRSRYGAQLGALDCFLRSNGSITIFARSSHAVGTSLQISRNLYQYFFADCNLVERMSDASQNSGNVAVISEGAETPITHKWFPIQVSAHGVKVEATGTIHKYPKEAGLGVIYLSPLPNEALQLNIWGSDQIGLSLAARLVPMLNGVGQPDFIVVSKRCAFKGAGGILAGGFFDHSWNVAKASYLQ